MRSWRYRSQFVMQQIRGQQPTVHSISILHPPDRPYPWWTVQISLIMPCISTTRRFKYWQISDSGLVAIWIGVSKVLLLSVRKMEILIDGEWVMSYHTAGSGGICVLIGAVLETRAKSGVSGVGREAMMEFVKWQFRDVENAENPKCWFCPKSHLVRDTHCENTLF